MANSVSAVSDWTITISDIVPPCHVDRRDEIEKRRALQTRTIGLLSAASAVVAAMCALVGESVFGEWDDIFTLVFSAGVWALVGGVVGVLIGLLASPRIKH